MVGVEIGAAMGLALWVWLEMVGFGWRWLGFSGFQWGWVVAVEIDVVVEIGVGL